MNPKSKYERLQFLAASLAKVLQKSPPTYYDESPLATWVETVDKLSGELLKELGGITEVSAAAATLSALNSRGHEAQEFVQEHGIGVVGDFTWFGILDYAKTAADRQRRLEEGVSCARREALDAREEVSILEGEVARLKEELTRQPRRFRTVG